MSILSEKYITLALMQENKSVKIKHKKNYTVSIVTKDTWGNLHINKGKNFVQGLFTLPQTF